MSDDNLVGAEDETFDFSGDGVKTQPVTVEVVGFEITRKPDKNDDTITTVRHSIEFKVTDQQGEVLPFTVKKSEWFSYPSSEQAQSIGRGNLKKIAKGLLGVPSYTRDTIMNATAAAELFENKDGFADVRKFKRIESAANLG